MTALAGIALALCIVTPTAEAKRARWSPGPTVYGVGLERNAAVEMKDGTVLRADVYFPTNVDSGERAAGSFPVVMNMTPYGKRSLAFLEQSSSPQDDATGLARTLSDFVTRGYINVVVDIRGTGRSEGSFSLLDPIQGRDGAELVRWAARLPGSNGRVGLYGPSYMGIVQYFTAANLGRRSPLKAMLPLIAANSPYRELVTAGGMPSGETSLPLLAVFVALPLLMPLIDDDGFDPAATISLEQRGVRSLLEELLPLTVDVASGGPRGFDEEYWRARAPGEMLERVADTGVPILSVGGWFDVFQRGALMNYAGLQNAAAGRPVTAPMRRRQRASDRYQVVMGPWMHLNAGEGFPLADLAMRWFDGWLKGERGGLQASNGTAHLYDIGRERWVDTDSYPFSEARTVSLFFDSGPSGSDAPSSNDGSLSHHPPDGEGDSDTLAVTGATSPCTLSADQYSLGALTLATRSFGLRNPCLADDRTLQLGPGALTYTSQPFERDMTVAGPLAASVWATSNREELALVATVEDVAANGGSRPLTGGALLGSLRAVELGRSWFGTGQRSLLPYHPYTRASAQPVPPGERVRYQIEIFPTFATIREGHRLRLTLTSADSPHVTPTPAQFAAMAGGVNRVHLGGETASHLNVPLAPAGRLDARCRFCG